MKIDPVKILVIDDEEDMTRTIRLTINVQEPDWIIYEAHTGSEGLSVFDERKPSLVLLDIRMPGMSGLDVIKKLRTFSDVPVIFITVENDELSEVQALESGADDFIGKPFGNLELVAHIRSVLRRAYGYSSTKQGVLNIGTLVIDLTSHTVRKGDRLVSLTSTEYAFLELLANNPGQVIPFDLILGKIWGQYALGNRSYLKVYIRKLRVKLEDDPSNPEYIITVNGLGYKFEDKN